MTHELRFDHVGITVADLDAMVAFFVELGLHVEGRTFVEGDFVDTVTALSGARSEIVMLRTPGGGTAVELSRFVRPEPVRGPAADRIQETGLRSLSFEVPDLVERVARLATAGFGLVGGVGRYEDAWLMAYVRGPEGVIVALAQRLE